MVATTKTALPENSRWLVPQAARAAGSMPPRTSTPRSSRSSRRSSWGRSSAIASCRWRIVSGAAGCEQPGGQCLLAGPRSGRAEPLEERALAKEVEIGRVGVLEVEVLESLARPGRPSGPRAAPIPWNKSRRPGGLDRRPAESARERAPERRKDRPERPATRARQPGRGRSRRPERAWPRKRSAGRRRPGGRASSSARVPVSARRAGGLDCVEIVRCNRASALLFFNHVVAIPSGCRKRPR